MSAIRLIFFMFSLFLSAFARAEVQVLLDENFDNWDPKKTPGIGIGSQAGGEVGVSTDVNEVFGGSGGSLKASYPKANGGIYGWASFDMKPYDAYEVYVEFYAKMPKAKQGIKFLKIFGGANTTFGLDYTGIQSGKGSMYQVSFGDGKTISNDTQNVINFNGNNPSWIGRSYGTAVVKTEQKKNWAAEDWGDSWHHFRFKVKFNSVDRSDGLVKEIADGEAYVEIDGKTYVDAKQLYNRHPDNGPITKIALLDWSQSIDQPFEIWYDNVTISLGGFKSNNESKPKSPEAILN